MLACRYHYRNWAVTPLKPKSKAAYKNNWQHTTVSDFDIKDFRGNGNIGIINEAKFCDIDLDCSETLKIADMFLPFTPCAFGRSAGETHRIYQIEENHNAKWKDPTLPEDSGCILEMRGGGQNGNTQTMAPPSIWVSKDGSKQDIIHWYRYGNPYKTSSNELRQRCTYIAVAILLARNWPGIGQRHDCYLPLSGGLARAKVNEPNAKLIVSPVRWLHKCVVRMLVLLPIEA